MLSATSATTAALNRNSRLLDWYLMPEAYSAPLVHDAMREFDVGPGDTVLDPFCGTGTTLVAAMLEGRNALGIEVNPFLCFATRVKTHHDHDLTLLRAHVARVVAAARVSLDGACDDALGQAGVPLPAMPRLERWIARKVACKVALLRRCIEDNTTEATRDVPMLALASILRGASNMKLSPHAFGSREVKQDAPVLAMFESRVNKILEDIEWLAAEQRIRPLGRAEVVNGDVRSAAGMEHDLLPARLAICSPPYLNNLDYTMQTRMELFFLGMVNSMEELKGLRKRMMICDAKATYRDIEDWQRVEEVGSVREVARLIDDKLGDRGWGWDYGRMTRQYFGGLLRAMEAVRPMLAPGAPLVMIVGESAHSGVLVPVPDLTAELGRLAGYTSAEVRTLRMRRSSSHGFRLRESAVTLRN